MSLPSNDIQDLRTCGLVAKCARWRQVFYALKDAILTHYGTPDGYDLQVWTETDLDTLLCHPDTPADTIVAEHRHILRRYRLGDQIFHRPTNEFYYVNYATDYERISWGFVSLKAHAIETLHGTRRPASDPASRQAAWSALKRLLRRHRTLLPSSHIATPAPRDTPTWSCASPSPIAHQRRSTAAPTPSFIPTVCARRGHQLDRFAAAYYEVFRCHRCGTPLADPPPLMRRLQLAVYRVQEWITETVFRWRCWLKCSECGQYAGRHNATVDHLPF